MRRGRITIFRRFLEILEKNGTFAGREQGLVAERNIKMRKKQNNKKEVLCTHEIIQPGRHK